MNLFLFHYLGCVKPETCEPEFGVGYKGCDFTYFYTENWEKCSMLCFLIPKCKVWTWIRLDPVTVSLCWIKTRTCGYEISSIKISGGKKCANLSIDSNYCVPDYGIEYPGCDMEMITGIKSWQKCSQLCHVTQGCKLWTWFHKNHNVSSYSCSLKRGSCVGRPFAYSISGDDSTYLNCNPSCD